MLAAQPQEQAIRDHLLKLVEYGWRQREMPNTPAAITPGRERIIKGPERSTGP